ncbi:MAG TPA: SDR family oxidoreductase [Acidimicrobiales bacterium]|nr:SDR family oxidoreductase [Acidimicrobiales bacterium]
MKVLFIGGTGIISSACTPAVIEAGHGLWHLNRGRSPLPAPPQVHHLQADIRDKAEVRRAIADLTWDVVVQWLAFTPEHISQDLEVFAGRAGQYVFISSASAYQKPPQNWLITEKTPLENPFWQYSRDKIACERLLGAQSEMPWTVVRPSHTYGPSQVPVAFGSWSKPYTIIDRMRRGSPVLVPGDGTSIWTVTHNSDFARGFLGVLGHPGALGEAFHITSDEALSWNQIYELLAQAAGTRPNLLHVPTDALRWRDEAEWTSLWGDKSHCAVFDNSKIRKLVPGFQARVPFAQGIGETVKWFDADPSRQQVDVEANEIWDRFADIYTRALEEAGGGAGRN